MFVVSKIQFANVRLGKKTNGEQVAGNKSIGALSQFGNSG